MTGVNVSVARHYGRRSLLDDVEVALERAGLHGRRLTPADLAPLDHFHSGGVAATRALAQWISPASRVIDVGGGIGGAARLLATEFDCRVSVVDLTPEYCEVGARLTERCGLPDRVSFHVGDALSLPFPDRSFDLAWTQHSTMNIDDKPRLYRELRRVLAKQGRYAMHEILVGADGPPIYPTPWAETERTSFLATAEQTQRMLEAAGFEIERWEDTTAASIDWFRDRPAPGASSPALGVHVLLGAKFGAAFANQQRNLEEGRVGVARALLRTGT